MGWGERMYMWACAMLAARAATSAAEVENIVAVLGRVCVSSS